MQAKTAAWRASWLVAIWQLHLMKRRTKRTQEKSSFSLSLARSFSRTLFCFALLCFFFCYKITSRVSFITWGYVVYAVHDNDVKSAQKISRGCHRLCVIQDERKLPAIDHTCLMKCPSLERRTKQQKKNELTSFFFLL